MEKTAIVIDNTTELNSLYSQILFKLFESKIRFEYEILDDTYLLLKLKNNYDVDESIRLIKLIFNGFVSLDISFPDQENVTHLKDGIHVLVKIKNYEV